MATSSPKNIGAADAPYFVPAPPKPTGTALSPSSSTPTLFTPLTIRGVTFQNRIWVAPMCTYSASAGHLTEFHLAHLSAFAFRGASLTIIEATAVQPEGRISPEDSGLWQDSQIAPIRRIADFVHSQGQKLGIQLAHAGRKASTVAPWLVPVRGESITATADAGGWPDKVKGASAIRWGKGYAEPREMTLADIRDVIDGFRDSAVRAVEAGVDVIELHAAHGYLLCSFLSPISNRRTDDYGGSFENRIRIVLDVIKATRKVIPESMPLLLRISASEWMDGHELGSWRIEDSIALAKLLPALGVDLLDCSSGGNHPEQTISMHHEYQIGLAGQIRAVGIKGLLIGAVGMITEAEAAKEIVEEGKKVGGLATPPESAKAQSELSAAEVGKSIEIEDEQGKIAKADVVLVARQFLREPEWVLRVAYRLGVDVQWPLQYGRGTFPRGSRV